MSKTRSTIRKRQIQQTLAGLGGRPVVLEELRWLVWKKELEGENLPVGTMSVSYQKSFNRSLRSFVPTMTPEFVVHKITTADGWSAGFLARAAVFRLDRVALVDEVLGDDSITFHFWTNARTTDVWQEGGNGEVEVLNEGLLPERAPSRLASLFPGGSRWPRSSPERQQGLEQLGPKWKKRPLVCVKLRTRPVSLPSPGDDVAVIRMPTNLPLSVIGPAKMGEEELRMLRSVPWTLYQRKRGVTRVIPADQLIV